MDDELQHFRDQASIISQNFALQLMSAETTRKRKIAAAVRAGIHDWPVLSSLLNEEPPLDMESRRIVFHLAMWGENSPIVGTCFEKEFNNWQGLQRWK